MQRKNSKSRKIMDGKRLKVAVVVSEFNRDITGNLLQGALGVLSLNNVKKNNTEIVWVPGSFELPLACQKLAKMKKYDAIVVLGCVIKGETDHYYFVAGEASRGVMEVMLKHELPIGFGIITTNNLKQAKDRSGKKSNKGAEAAEAALQMLNIRY